MATTAVNNSSPSTSVAELVASFLRAIESLVRQICLRIDEYGITALLKTVLLFVVLFAVKENLKHTFGYECPEENYYFYETFSFMAQQFSFCALRSFFLVRSGNSERVAAVYTATSDFWFRRGPL